MKPVNKEQRLEREGGRKNVLVSLVVGQRNLSKIPPSPTGPERKGSDYYRIIPLLVVFSPLPFVFLFWVIFVVSLLFSFFSWICDPPDSDTQVLWWYAWAIMHGFPNNFTLGDSLCCLELTLKLSLTLNFRSSYTSLLNSWDYRPAPPGPAPYLLCICSLITPFDRGVIPIT